MSIHNDLTFFTNEPDRNLYDRFNKVLKSNTKFFDILVGYFRTSGFYLMYPAMEDIEKIRVLVGLDVDSNTIQIIQKSKEEQLSFEMSHKEIKTEFINDIQEELENSEDSYRVEKGVKTFIKWLQSGKIEMRIFPDSPIHAKVYIMRKDMDKVPDQYGSVITGSSNFSQAGLVGNLEFNVELKDSRDVEFALQKFEDLWEKSVDITDEYISSVTEKTWIRDDITPYELFLKTLYEYFKEEINEDKNETYIEYLPDGFMQLQYQTDAVMQAKKILDAYGGVFISDVVGLGKTFICAMLAQRLNGGKLIICPPVLKEYWERTLIMFDVSAKVESVGKLDHILADEEMLKRTKYIFIDEAHRFRNNKTESYEKLHQICYNKKVILISATPQNNYSIDIANQIFLFQPKNNSSIIPNYKNLELFFNRLQTKLNKLEKGAEEYSKMQKENSEIIRDKVLRNIMIRRTRKEIMEFYKEDLELRGLKFPELSDPEKIVYSYNDRIENAFNDTIEIIKELTYSRYKPLTYLENIPKSITFQLAGQANMSGFMKSILIKRLESSFYAFKKTLNRFILSYQRFIDMCENGEVYISKKIDVYDLLDNGDDERIMELVDEDLIQYFPISDFNQEFVNDLNKDLLLLQNLANKWADIDEDPKKEQFLFELSNRAALRNQKIIIFTESKETAEYVGSYLEDIYPDKVIVYSGESSKSKRIEIEANYNPNYAYEKKDEIKYLVTTDVLAEGINLHRSNVIINYDLPWNPTKVMQRVGRINRVGTEHDEIFVFNFFPTAQANLHLPLKENILTKMQAFHDTLGEDFKYLSDEEEISTHNLYEKLNSKEGLEAEEKEEVSELKYLKIIRDIRDNNEELYEKIKKLPQKSRTGRVYRDIDDNYTITYLRKGGLKKFFIANNEDSKELYFLQAMEYLEAKSEERKIKTPKEYYNHLEFNKLSFEITLAEEDDIIIDSGVKTGNDKKVIKLLKAISKCRSFTDIEDETIKNMINLWEDGNIPANITKDVLKLTKEITDPIKVYYEIIELVPERYFEKRKNKKKNIGTGDIKVILSSYLKKGE